MNIRLTGEEGGQCRARRSAIRSDEDLSTASSDKMYCAPEGLDLDTNLNAVSHSSFGAVVLISHSIPGRDGAIDDGAASHYDGHYDVVLCFRELPGLAKICVHLMTTMNHNLSIKLDRQQ